MPEWAYACLHCPACGGPLIKEIIGLACARCNGCFPEVYGRPILIDGSSSIFDPANFITGSPTYFKPRSPLFAWLNRLVPSPSARPCTKPNLRRLRDLLLTDQLRPRVLVLGCGEGGHGLEELDDERIRILNCDVALTGRATIVCDGHALPFKDGSFDAVVAQFVLQHVVDPYRCVREIHRVLGPNGMVFAETAFVQHVCGGAYDFQRFTHLGIRRLFARFEELASGAAMGPATALVWSYENLLLALAGGRRRRNIIKAFARISAFPVKLLDFWIIRRPAALDAASAIYFLGRKSEGMLADRDLPGFYRGAWLR